MPTYNYFSKHNLIILNSTYYKIIALFLTYQHMFHFVGNGALLQLIYSYILFVIIIIIIY